MIWRGLKLAHLTELVLYLTFSNIEGDFAEIEMVDYLWILALNAHVSAANWVCAVQSGVERWVNRSVVDCTQTARLSYLRRVADSYFDVRDSRSYRNTTLFPSSQRSDYFCRMLRCPQQN